MNRPSKPITWMESIKPQRLLRKPEAEPELSREISTAATD
jgi:hypothetical protein